MQGLSQPVCNTVWHSSGWDIDDAWGGMAGWLAVRIQNHTPLDSAPGKDTESGRWLLWRWASPGLHTRTSGDIAIRRLGPSLLSATSRSCLQVVRSWACAQDPR